MVLQEAKKMRKGKLESGRDTGIGMWVQEVGLDYQQNGSDVRIGAEFDLNGGQQLTGLRSHGETSTTM